MPSPYVVAIDAGHGGTPGKDPAALWDPGVVVGSVMEKDITLDLAYRLKALLEKDRAKVVMTRSADQYVEISERWNRVHESGARAFVSLHINAFDGDAGINGFTIFYPKSDSLGLAQAIERSLSVSLRSFQSVDRGVSLKPELWVKSDIPTATVEPAYLTNSREAGLLQQTEFRQAIVAGVHAGLLAADPQIEATGKQIEQLQAQAAARHQAELANTGFSHTSGWWKWALAAVGSLLLWWLVRGALLRPPQPSPIRRRSSRRRRVSQRRY
jgi:hypothetical protein